MAYHFVVWSLPIGQWMNITSIVTLALDRSPHFVAIVDHFGWYFKAATFSMSVLVHPPLKLDCQQCCWTLNDQKGQQVLQKGRSLVSRQMPTVTLTMTSLASLRLMVCTLKVVLQVFNQVFASVSDTQHQRVMRSSPSLPFGNGDKNTAFTVQNSCGVGKQSRLRGVTFTLASSTLLVGQQTKRSIDQIRYGSLIRTICILPQFSERAGR